MSYLHGVEQEPADGPLTALFASERRSWGYLPNLARTLAIRPAVYQAWRDLNGAIKATMPQHRYELATLAAAVELRSTYCSLAHGRILATMLPEEQVIAVTTHDDAVLDPADRAIVVLARRIVRGAPDVQAADLDAVRAFGLDDEELFDLVATVAARCFFSTLLDATGTAADAVFTDMDAPLRDALTVGRPIEEPAPVSG